MLASQKQPTGACDGLLAGVDRITFLTSDLDPLVGFYQEVFGARKLMELSVPEPEGPGRHALITLGGV